MRKLKQGVSCRWGVHQFPMFIEIGEVMSVIVYSKPGCVQCVATVNHLSEAGVKFCVVDLVDQPEALEVVKSLGYLQAPVVVTSRGHWSGYRPDALSSLSEFTESTCVDSECTGGDCIASY